jgi:hypothetical protein
MLLALQGAERVRKRAFRVLVPQVLNLRGVVGTEVSHGVGHPVAIKGEDLAELVLRELFGVAVVAGGEFG